MSRPAPKPICKLDHHSQAREFHRHAKEFREASVRLSGKTPFLYHPSFYCILHSIELALKAALAFSGVTKKTLASRELGHDLGALVKEVFKMNAIDKEALGSRQWQIIQWGGSDYKSKCFEYPELPSSGATAPIGLWTEIADVLIQQVTHKLNDTV